MSKPFALSFRIRIALLSGLLFGVILVVIGVGMHRVLLSLKTDQLDETLRRTAYELIPQVHASIRRQTAAEDLTLADGFGLFFYPARDQGDSLRIAFPVDVVEKLKDRAPQAVDLAPDESQQRPDLTDGLDQPPPPPPPFARPDLERGDGTRAPRNREGPRRGGPQLAPPKAEYISEQVIQSQLSGSAWRVAEFSLGASSVYFGYDVAIVEDDIEQVMRAGLLISPLVIFLVVGASWLLASRAVKPIRKLTRHAQSITAQDLSQRIESEREDTEFAELITVFNQMLERLQASFHQSQRFSSNAAHELKTPLTILQGHLEQSFANAPDNSAEQLSTHSMLEEVHRLKSITERLLLLSKSDSGTLTLVKSELDLGEFLEGLYEDAQLLDPKLKFEASIEKGLRLKVDPALLYQLVTNLVNNAIKYNRTGGFVRLELKGAPDAVILRVINAGDPIPGDGTEKIFERFYRADLAHNRRIDGIGLGLNIALEIAHAHGGELILETNQSDQIGFKFTLPRA